jgi:hypothetical protein
MQRNDDAPENQLAKTAVVLGVINLLSSPSYLFGKSVGVLFSLATNAFSIYAFHRIGQSQRPVSNFITAGMNFFSATSNNLSNVYQNIITGGAAIADDEVVKDLKKSIESYIKPRR